MYGSLSSFISLHYLKSAQDHQLQPKIFTSVRKNLEKVFKNESRKVNASSLKTQLLANFGSSNFYVKLFRERQWRQQN